MLGEPRIEVDDRPEPRTADGDRRVPQCLVDLEQIVPAGAGHSDVPVGVVRLEGCRGHLGARRLVLLGEEEVRDLLGERLDILRDV